MTALVGIRCKNGVVIGADGSATFVHGQQRTIEQPAKKIEIIDNHVIVAGTGYVGHAQRFCHVVQRLWKGGSFKNKDAIEIGKMLSQSGIQDFQDTGLTQLDFSALVAYSAKDGMSLCELPSVAGFQPEIKTLDGIWWVAAGSGQPILDPLLAFFRSIFWKEELPTLRGGIFTALWALLHACEVNPGGINEPISIAILEHGKKGKLARLLPEEELSEHRSMVKDATEHMASFRNILLGHTGDSKMPTVERQ